MAVCEVGPPRAVTPPQKVVASEAKQVAGGQVLGHHHRMPGDVGRGGPAPERPQEAALKRQEVVGPGAQVRVLAVFESFAVGRQHRLHRRPRRLVRVSNALPNGLQDVLVAQHEGLRLKNGVGIRHQGVRRPHAVGLQPLLGPLHGVGQALQFRVHRVRRDGVAPGGRGGGLVPVRGAQDHAGRRTGALDDQFVVGCGFRGRFFHGVNGWQWRPALRPAWRLEQAGLDLFSESVRKKRLDRVGGLGLVRPFHHERERRPLLGGQGHDPNDALSVDFVVVAPQVDLRLKLGRGLDEHRRRPRVQAGPVADGDLAFNHGA